MLTTKQFINKVNELEGFVADISESYGINVVAVYSKNQVSEDSLHRVVAIGDAVHFYDCDLLNHFEDIKLLNLINEYVNTQPSERNAEEKYYIYWCDFSGVFYFLSDIAINDPDNFSNNTGFESLGNLITCEKDDIHHYQLTESDIKQLPNQWIPSEFGGIGFTRIISVD